MNDYSNYTDESHVNGRNLQLWNDPNKYARPVGIEIFDDHVVFHGYQEFELYRDSINILEIDASLRKKHELLSRYFAPAYLQHRTVQDLGASSGYFCFLALQKGVKKAVALDMDAEYIDMMVKAREKMLVQNLDVIKTNVTDWHEKADITLALALVHWIYSCTAIFGSIDSIVRKLAEITNYMLIVEWIEPGDPAIEFFHHIEWNKNYVRDEYEIQQFEKSLSDCFARVDLAGDISPTRRLYVCYKCANEIYLSGPLPLLKPKDTVISSRILTTYERIDYWSRVYDGYRYIIKQTTGNLAEREGHFYKVLDSPYFPQLCRTEINKEYSVVIMEKIAGAPLGSCREEIAGSATAIFSFFQDCLNILKCLYTKDIMHRDIRVSNLIMRDMKPVLIDFGWAIQKDEQGIMTPDGLGGEGMPPDNILSDVYSMGKVFDLINRGKYRHFDTIIQLMIEPDRNIRLMDLEMLELLFDVAAREEDINNQI